ncbi:MAG TPA: helix-turn-helix domain-containing protein, partial [Bacteroidales bacterium]|nr:helix-turn-helix domain-containing protein [Bacteroidales bacterium]
TLELFQMGKNVEQIAKERGLAVTTIEGHLSHWVRQGEIQATLFVDPQKLEQILEVARRIESLKLNDLKARLGDEFTYSDLKFALAHHQWNQEETQENKKE